MAWMATGDFIAAYAALMSTLLALVQLIKWLFKGPRLTVYVFYPESTNIGQERWLTTIVSNNGDQSVVVSKLTIAFKTSRWPWSKEIGRKTFHEGSGWNPAVKMVQSVTNRNSVTKVPNVLHPSEELRANADPIMNYDPFRHWIKVTAFARNKRLGFSGWAKPANHTLGQGA